MPEGVPEGAETEAEVRQEQSSGSSDKRVYVEVGEKVPRDFYISKKDGEKHGFSKGCGGCSSWFRGLGRQPHTEACRARFKEFMKNDAKVKNKN